MLYRSKNAYHDIEPAKQLDGLVDGSLDVRLLANVGLERGGLDVGETLLDERERLLGGGKVDVDEEDVRALLREEERGLKPDAAIDRWVGDWGCWISRVRGRIGAITHDPAPVMRAD